MRTKVFVSSDARALGRLVVLLLSVFSMVFLSPKAIAAPRGIEFSKPAASDEVYDFVEIAVSIEGPDANNPFVDVNVSGTFQLKVGSKSFKIDGFCDSEDGRTFRIRFMPSEAGDYVYTVTYKQGSFQKA